MSPLADAYATGWDHGAYALAWTLGVFTVYALLGAIAWAVAVPGYRAARTRWTSWHTHRATTRSGRT